MRQALARYGDEIPGDYAHRLAAEVEGLAAYREQVQQTQTLLTNAAAPWRVAAAHARASMPRLRELFGRLEALEAELRREVGGDLHQTAALLASWALECANEIAFLHEQAQK